MSAAAIRFAMRRRIADRRRRRVRPDHDERHSVDRSPGRVHLRGTRWQRFQGKCPPFT